MKCINFYIGNNMISRINTFLWYIKNPNYWGQLFNLILRKFYYKDDEFGKDEAETWCRGKGKNREAILSLNENLRITTLIDPAIAYKNLFEEVDQKISNIPLMMGEGSDIIILYNLVRLRNVKKVLETGVAYGWSSLAILLAFQEKKEGILYSTDMPYAKMNNEKYVGTIVPEKLHVYWKLIRKPDIKAIPEAIRLCGNFDLIHYDSDKSYSGKKWAYPLLWKVLNCGGFFISDDINDNIAFKEFCDDINKKPLIIKNTGKYIGILTK